MAIAGDDLGGIGRDSQWAIDYHHHGDGGDDGDDDLAYHPFPPPLTPFPSADLHNFYGGSVVSAGYRLAGVN
jgi:hypothetical protein